MADAINPEDAGYHAFLRLSAHMQGHVINTSQFMSKNPAYATIYHVHKEEE